MTIEVLGELGKLVGAGGLGAALVVGYLFIKGYIVPGYMYKEQKARADKNEERLFDAREEVKTAQRMVVKNAEVAKEIVAKQ